MQGSVFSSAVIECGEIAGISVLPALLAKAYSQMCLR